MISAKVLSSFSKHKIAILFCDEYYMPLAILHPYHQSALAASVEMPKSVHPHYADSLWKKIIIAKITLQKEVLNTLNIEIEKLDIYKKQVVEADKHGAEAKSARYYWSVLFDDIVREQNLFDICN